MTQIDMQFTIYEIIKKGNNLKQKNKEWVKHIQKIADIFLFQQECFYFKIFNVETV